MAPAPARQSNRADRAHTSSPRFRISRPRSPKARPTISAIPAHARDRRPAQNRKSRSKAPGNAQPSARIAPQAPFRQRSLERGGRSHQQTKTLRRHSQYFCDPLDASRTVLHPHDIFVMGHARHQRRLNRIAGKHRHRIQQNRNPRRVRHAQKVRSLSLDTHGRLVIIRRPHQSKIKPERRRPVRMLDRLRCRFRARSRQSKSCQPQLFPWRLPRSGKSPSNAKAPTRR